MGAAEAIYVLSRKLAGFALVCLLLVNSLMEKCPCQECSGGHSPEGLGSPDQHRMTGCLRSVRRSALILGAGPAPRLAPARGCSSWSDLGRWRPTHTAVGAGGDVAWQRLVSWASCSVALPGQPVRC